MYSRTSLLVVLIGLSCSVRAYAGTLRADVSAMMNAARSTRTVPWTKDVGSKLQLTMLYCTYRSHLISALSKEQRRPKTRDWVPRLIERYHMNELQADARAAMKDAIEARDELVQFAGSKVMDRIDKHQRIPHDLGHASITDQPR